MNWKLIYLFIAVAQIVGLVKCQEDFVVPPVTLSEAPYAPWAHFHWIWLANTGEENQTNIMQLVKDYQSYGVPVGAVNLDSAWPDKYQNFIFNEKNFPIRKSWSTRFTT